MSVPIRSVGFKHGVRHPVTGETIKKWPGLQGPHCEAFAGMSDHFGFAVFITSVQRYHPTDVSDIKPKPESNKEAVPRRTVVPMSDVAWIDVPMVMRPVEPGEEAAEVDDDAEAEAEAQAAIDAERAKLRGGGD